MASRSTSLWSPWMRRRPPRCRSEWTPPTSTNTELPSKWKASPPPRLWLPSQLGPSPTPPLGSHHTVWPHQATIVMAQKPSRSRSVVWKALFAARKHRAVPNISCSLHSNHDYQCLLATTRIRTNIYTHTHTHILLQQCACVPCAQRYAHRHTDTHRHTQTHTDAHRARRNVLLRLLKHLPPRLHFVVGFCTQLQSA